MAWLVWFGFGWVSLGLFFSSLTVLIDAWLTITAAVLFCFVLGVFFGGGRGGGFIFFLITPLGLLSSYFLVFPEEIHIPTTQHTSYSKQFLLFHHLHSQLYLWLSPFFVILLRM